MERIHDVEIRVTLVERAMIGEGYLEKMTPIDWLEDLEDMGEFPLKISTKILKSPRAELRLQYEEASVTQRADTAAFVEGILSAIREKLTGALK